MNSRYIIYDKWENERHIGTKVKCNKKNHCAFKIKGKVHIFHNEQVMLEKYIPLPKKLNVKTIYELSFDYSSSVYRFDSIYEILDYVRQDFNRHPCLNHKQFLDNMTITPKMVIYY